MTIDFHYGRDAVVRFDLPPQACVQSPAPRGEPIRDIDGAVAAALAEPLGYPTLAQALVPGDRVVLAIGDGVPQREAIASAVVRAMIDAGIEPADLTLLVTPATAAWLGQSAGASASDDGAERPSSAARQPSDPLANLAGAWPDIRRLVHDASDRRQMAFLARTSDQMQVMLNRVLTDADVVVSIGCLRPTPSLGYNGAAGVLCPTFSDEPTQKRFRSFHATDSPRAVGQAFLPAKQVSKASAPADEFDGARSPAKQTGMIAPQKATPSQRAREKTAEIAWLLGARFTVQVLPGRGDDVLHVLAGDLDAVAARGETLCDEAWRSGDLSAASLVVVALEGGSEQQTWDNVGLALAAAAEVTEPGGAIAICTELSVPPGEALQTLAGADDLNQATQAIRKSLPADALTALELVRALADHHVYLLSRLPAREVEDLGMVAVANAGELARLARGRPSCLLLAGGPHVQTAAVKSRVTV